MVSSRVLKRSALAALLAMTGCGNRFLENGFVDPSEVGTFEHKPLVVSILHSLDTGIEERDDKFVNAAEPKSSDMTVVKTDYTVGAGDLIQVGVWDLVTEGVEFQKQIRVADSGMISLPYLDQIKAAGLTESQLQQAIVQAYQDKSMLPKAIVSVIVAEARNRSFYIYGAVTQSGQYAILQSDFRLLDALVQARDVSTPVGIDYIYIKRHIDRDVTDNGATTEPAMENTAPAAPAPGSLAPKMMIMQAEAAPAPAPAPDPTMTPTTEPAGSAENHIIVVGDKPMQIEGGQATPMAATPSTMPSDMAMTPAMPATMPAAGTDTTGGAFAFNGLTEPTDVRWIKIPFDELKRGNLKYNIVIRPDDYIFVPYPETGEYYMGGHVQRTGVYSLTARTITLKQAVISAGGLDQLAIPQRTSITRRLSESREIIASVDLDKIFAGEEPDLILKPDDQVLVGSNFLAPFLSAFRSGFRITYGAGFIYDRNYYNQNNNGG